MTVKYSVLELAVVSAGVSIEETFRNSLDFAQHAERLGYHRIWLAEHHNMISIASTSPPVLIGFLAAGTSSIRVGSGGVMLPNHSPLIVAEQFGTLGRLYPGRIDLGLGRAPGTDQVTAQAIRPDRMRSALAFPEEVDLLHRYFSDEGAATHAVRATVAEGVNVPLYVLGSTTDSAHVAAAMGLPYAFASHFATEHLIEALAVYRREFKPSRWLDRPYVIAGVNVVAAPDNEEAEALSTSLIRMFVGVLTNQRDYLQPPSPMTDELRAILDHSTVKQMLRYSFVGDAEKITEDVRAFLKATGADELMAVMNMYDHRDRIRSAQIFAEIMKRINSPNPANPVDHAFKLRPERKP